MTCPGVWRRAAGGKGGTTAILYPVATGFVTCAGFILVCTRLGLGDILQSAEIRCRRMVDCATAAADHQRAVYQASPAHHIRALAWLARSPCGLRAGSGVDCAMMRRRWLHVSCGGWQ